MENRLMFKTGAESIVVRMGSIASSATTVAIRGFSWAMPGNRLRSIAPSRRKVYEALRRSGHSKETSARIANAGKTQAGRKRMAAKARRK